jgi:hypothetical protein
MPIDVSVDTETKIATIALAGDITGDDLQMVRTAIAKHSRRRRYFLIDTAAARLRVSAADIRRVAFADDAFPWRIAVYAPNLAAFGLARMFELLSGGRRDVAVFWDRDKAIGWLKDRSDVSARQNRRVD